MGVSLVDEFLVGDILEGDTLLLLLLAGVWLVRATGDGLATGAARGDTVGAAGAVGLGPNRLGDDCLG